MAVSATPRIADARLAVAYSGGRDSTALLHAVASQIRTNDLGDPRTLEVVALHVHHGLSPHADAWLAHCERQCADWAAQGLPVRLVARRLSGAPASAESVEAWARAARYAALAEMAREADIDLVLLAQHRRDQAETLLLQGLRGAGVAGLAGMPREQVRDGIRWSRPWLAQPREAIEAYLDAHRLSFVDDDSNADPRYARNRLRLAVWPTLAQAFPRAEVALARSAGWAQEALALQREVATADLAPLLAAGGLDLARLLALSPARASNALRAWLHETTGAIAPASLVERVLREGQGGVASWPCAGGALELYRGRLSWSPTAKAEALNLQIPSQSVNLGFPGLHRQEAWGGAFRVGSVPAGGIAAALAQDLTLRARAGGEQFQRGPRTALRSLKKAYQEAGVPGWARRGPLLFAGDRLVFAPGLGIDARSWAGPGEAQFVLAWEPDPVSVG